MTLAERPQRALTSDLWGGLAGSVVILTPGDGLRSSSLGTLRGRYRGRGPRRTARCRRSQPGLRLAGDTLGMIGAPTLAARGGRLIFATVRKGRGLGRKVRKTFRKISPHHANVPVDTYVDVDEALEEAENALLASLGRPAQDPERSVELAELDSPGEEIYLILSGEVDAVIRYSKHHHLRVGKFGPGTLLGEVSFIDPGPRTAEARVIRDGKAAILRRSAFDRIRQESPETAVRLVLALGRELADHLRSANASVSRLADQ